MTYKIEQQGNFYYYTVFSEKGKTLVTGAEGTELKARRKAQAYIRNWPEHTSDRAQ